MATVYSLPRLTAFIIGVQGDVAHHPAQIGQQRVRPGGRDRVPGAQIGVVDAFLRILRIVQDVAGDPAQHRPVFSVQFPDALFRPGEQQIQYRLVLFHRTASFPASPLYCVFRAGYYTAGKKFCKFFQNM